MEWEASGGWAVTTTLLAIGPGPRQPAGGMWRRRYPGSHTVLGCHFLFQGINPGIEPTSPVLQADSLSLSPLGSPKVLPLEKSRSMLTEKQPEGTFWVIQCILFA